MMPGEAPNIVVLVMRGLRPDCLGFSGNPVVQTPNLDAIAGHGVIFTHATRDDDARNGEDVLLDSLPQALHESGYQCFAAGGIGENLSGFDGIATIDQDYRPWLDAKGKTDRAAAWAAGEAVEMQAVYEKSFGAVRSNLDEAQHVSTWIGDQAVRFLRAPRTPFFLYLHFTKPAAPFDPPAPWDALYGRDTVELLPDMTPDADAGLSESRYRKILAHYYANITHVDQQVGRVLATLTARGRTNNVIVVAGDGSDPLAPEAILSRSQTMASTLPLAIAGLPGQRRGATDQLPADIHDLPPTILDAVTGSTPAQAAGTSLLPRLCDSV